MDKLLLADRDAEFRESARLALGPDMQVWEAGSAEAALRVQRAERPPLVCLDLGLEGAPEKGLAVLEALLAADRECQVVVLADGAPGAGAPGKGGPGTGDSGALGRDAIRKGAFDCLPRPPGLDGLRVILERAARLRALEREAWADAGVGFPEDPDFPMVGESEPMRRIFDQLRRLAGNEISVLITGESGTGKEVCARAIHHWSRRRKASFVPINCAAIPGELLESELFGHAKGSFTGADADKQGLIETAHRGTLFLDEIGDMPQGLQVKLLRFLQDHRLQRVGDTRFRPVDVRILAATHRSGARSGDPILRSDLYYRLSEFEIELPPLRARGQDALLIAARVLERNRRRFGRPRLRLSARAEKLILAHGWPGNVRELENRLNRASILCRGQVIEEDDLQLSGGVAGNLTYREAKKAFERDVVLTALRRTRGNVAMAARTVGVTRPTFYDLMRKSGVNVRMEEGLSASRGLSSSRSGS